MSIVPVTGGSGFVGVHTILQLLSAGHEVRTTVRRPERKTDVLAMLEQGGVPSADRLSFFTADLENHAGWREAVAGCYYVLHVASPLPIRTPRDESELIVPARDGTLRRCPTAPCLRRRKSTLASSTCVTSRVCIFAR
jgi:nucleoside-diphosphate-sugar epimerase